MENQEIIGLATYMYFGNVCELVSFDSKKENIGIGTALLKEVEKVALENNCKKMRLITTNDNLRALQFYQKRGYGLIKLYPNAMDEVRKTKPDVPLIGENGIPLNDEIELEKNLADKACVKMDIWEEMYQKAKKEYHPEDVSPFIRAHHVVAAVQSESGKIFTGFSIEGASGVMNLCAERVAALNMYISTGETKIKRLIAFRAEPPKINGGMPCGACREFLMQLNYDNRDMEIITDYESRKIVYLKDIVPNWWGDKRYNNL